MSETERNDDGSFETDLRASLTGIRGSLTELMASVDADPSQPQVVSRTIKINRNLAWKLSRIVGADEPLATIDHIPGRTGLRIMLEAFQRAGAPATAIERTESAVRDFERIIEVHTGDRATLDHMVGNLLPRHLRVERHEAARKLAYQGISATWGIQARVRLATMFMAPNPDDPTRVDIATLGGLVGYRRLRGGTSWPLMRVYSYQDDGTPIDTARHAISPSADDPMRAPLLEEFCRGEQPEIRGVPFPGGVQYELGDGPIGNRGLVTSVFGIVTRSFSSCYRDEANEVGEHLVHWFTPVEAGLCDLIVHRELPFEMPPSVSVCGRLTVDSADPLANRGREQIPVSEVVQDLGAGPPVLSTPLVPDYAKMAQTFFDRMGWDPGDFAAYRFVMRYPPVPSFAVLSFPLAQREG